MQARHRTAALLTGIVAGTLELAVPAIAQTSTAPRDSAPHFSLFGGVAAAEQGGPESGLEAGVSGDFRWRPVPVPLRLSVSFSQHDMYGATLRGGKASLDLVMRPFARHFGIQPYFLGGLGIATRTGYAYWATPYLGPNLGFAQPLWVSHGRETWAFGSLGVGLDIGRAFIQLKAENPVASQGPFVVPLNIGFRFWD